MYFIDITDSRPDVPVVVFLAKGKNDSIGFGKNQPIFFPVVIKNAGSGYDGRIGIFGALVSGAYMFSATLLNNPPNSRSMNAAITKYGGSEIWFTCRDDTVYDSCSATMAVTMQMGDEVWMEHYSGGESDVWCSFTGILVTPL